MNYFKGRQNIQRLKPQNRISIELSNDQELLNKLKKNQVTFTFKGELDRGLEGQSNFNGRKLESQRNSIHQSHNCQSVQKRSDNTRINYLQNQMKLLSSKKELPLYQSVKNSQLSQSSIRKQENSDLRNLQNNFEQLKKSLSNNKELIEEYEPMIDNIIVLKKDDNSCQSKTVRSISQTSNKTKKSIQVNRNKRSVSITKGKPVLKRIIIRSSSQNVMKKVREQQHLFEKEFRRQNIGEYQIDQKQNIQQEDVDFSKLEKQKLISNFEEQILSPINEKSQMLTSNLVKDKNQNIKKFCLNNYSKSYKHKLDDQQEQEIFQEVNQNIQSQNQSKNPKNILYHNWKKNNKNSYVQNKTHWTRAKIEEIQNKERLTWRERLQMNQFLSTLDFSYLNKKREA